MKFLTSLLALSVLSVLPWTLHATNCHTYGSDEYVTVAHGTSPDGAYGITAHGTGEYGYVHFHIYLTDAETGKKIGPLEEIKGALDTGASSFAAQWSPDSSTVSIIYRIDRHLPLQVVSYRINKHRAYQLEGPVNVTDEQLHFWQASCQTDQPAARVFGKPAS